MKLPYSWIKEYVNVTAAPRDYAHTITIAGSKVEGLECLGQEISGVVIGQIMAIDQHPDADKLVVCTVNIGESQPIVICTGATNLKTGDIVPVATHGSKLPGGITIKKTKMRGVESNGMLCSIGELNLTPNDFPTAVDDGILVLTEGDLNIGDDACDYLGLRETIIEFEITSNRPDCLSAIGLAKETAATYGLSCDIKTPSVKNAQGNISDYISVTIDATDLCSRYTGAIVKDVKIAPSPMWLRKRLRDCGVRPINNIVDITNYVMLEYGQPMHSFDYSCITDRAIVVRRANPGEKIETLDGTMRDLPDNALIIADRVRPIGVAGVMGGANSEITDSTKIVAFEAGSFNGVSVRNTSRKLNMRTEASARFEKGLDSENTMPAIIRALQLVEELGAGTVVSGITDVYPSPKKPRTLEIEYDKINALIGISLEPAEINRILTTLSFTVSGTTATIPSFRDDVTRMADLAEEVARIYGYDKIPSTINAGQVTQGGYSDLQKFQRSIKEYCRSGGYTEVLTLSFTGDRGYDKLCLPKDSALRQSLTITNPLGEDQKYLRTTTVHSILEVVARNFNYRVAAAQLFEIAKIYKPVLTNGQVDATVQPLESMILTMAQYASGDFYAIKGRVEAVLKALAIDGCTIRPCTTNSMYHPGRCAAVTAGDVHIGYIGQFHPDIVKNYEIDAEVYGAELDTAVLYALHNPEKLYTPLPRFPATTRDLALVCDESVPVLDLELAIREMGGKILEDIRLFDIYRGPKLGENKKSVAFSLTLRHSDHTLTDEEVDKVIRRGLINVETKCGGVLRS